MKTDFNRELEKVKNGEKHSILIEALVNEPTFIDCLFDEFKQTPLKKDVSKYLSQFNTDKEKEKELNAMIKDFYSLKETPKEFYTHDITKTNIYQNFKAIEAVTRELRQTMIEPEKKAEIISNITATLHPNIKKLVINTLIKDNDNIYLNLNFVFGNGKRATQNEKEKWEFVKVVFNDKLSESLLSQIETKIIDLPNTEPKEPTLTKQGRPKTVIHEASYYLHNKELLQFLIDNYSNTKPRYFNQLLSVLADIEINQLKPATKKEYNVAFGKALNVKQKQSNFDNYFIGIGA